MTGYIRKIERLSNASTGDLFYRGHPDISFTLTPSVFRSSSLKKNEKNIIYRAMAESPKEFDRDKYFFDKLVRAQHYGIPTRLLDLTVNPLIALYFACESHTKNRGQIVVLDVPKGSTKFFLSDAVSCKSNLAQLSPVEHTSLKLCILASCEKVLGEKFKRKKLLDWREEFPDKWKDVIENFNKYRNARRLTQFIREEKPHFEGKIDPIDLLKPDVILPKKSNSRIAAQSGAFLGFGLNDLLSDNNLIRHNIKKTVIDISEESKHNFLIALGSIGISESFVYPEFDRAAKQIKKLFS
ncbi:FRG domain-containing protein [Natronohydrobacter thiooxidans]|uniref:FRG domain-containing protein n=1 Tax=Natronohydrobacter thiooxidans TaxID=87172 RepID=UPI0015875A4C|nr:FRG domain-containing protein [Natronohydrobacter thiooxidans]